MTNQSPIKVFITGAANGLAEVREGLADHPDVELVGTAADPVKAGAKLAESAAQVILHGTHGHRARAHAPRSRRSGRSPPRRSSSSPPASANTLLSEALQAGIHDVVLLPQLTDGIVFTIKKAHSPPARPRGRRRRQGHLARRGQGRDALLAQGRSPARPRSPATWPTLFARKHGRRTLLLDLDLQFGDVAIMMGDRARQDDLRPGHGPARARHRGSWPATSLAPVRRARAAGAASARGRRAGHRGAPRPPVRGRQGELRRGRRRHAAVLPRRRCSRRSTAPTSCCSSTSMDIPAIKNVKLTLQTLDLLHYPKDRRHLVLNRPARRPACASEVERALDLKVAFELPADRDVPSPSTAACRCALANPRAGVVEGRWARSPTPSSPSGVGRRRQEEASGE